MCGCGSPHKPTDATQTYVDITDRLRDCTWRYGRNDGLGTLRQAAASSPSTTVTGSSIIAERRHLVREPEAPQGVRDGGEMEHGGIPAVRRLHQRVPNSTRSRETTSSASKCSTRSPSSNRASLIGFSRPDELTSIAAVSDAIGVPAALRDIDPGTIVAAITIDTAGTSGLGHAKKGGVEQ